MAQVRKEGDWWCLQCGFHNFAKNEACRGCKAPRTHSDAENIKPEAQDPQTFIANFPIEESKKMKFLSLLPHQQKIIIEQGPLVGVRDPTAVLASRMNRLPKDQQTAAMTPQGQYSSTCTKYQADRGIGFILAIPELSQSDIFLHHANIVDNKVPFEGDTLTFDLEPAPKGNGFSAINVRGGHGGSVEAARKGKGKGKGGNGPYGGGNEYEQGMQDMFQKMMGMMGMMKGMSGGKGGGGKGGGGKGGGGGWGNQGGGGWGGDSW